MRTATSLRSFLRQALSSHDYDFTEGPIGRAVVLLSIPMVLEMAMESLFAICDIFYVSRLGVEAVAAVGLTEAVVTLVYSVAAGMSMAVTAMVARRIGEKNRQGAAVATVQGLYLALFSSLLISIPGSLFAGTVLRLMGASPELVAQGQGFTTVLLGGSATIMFLFLINAAFRGAGDAALAMRTLWIANGINLVLDPCLIFGLGPFPQLGLTGAAVATTIGRGVGVLYQARALARGSGRLQIGLEVLAFKPRVVARLLRVSAGGVGQFLISHSSWLALVRIVSAFGSAAVAGYTVAIRLVIFALLPSWGVSGSAATLMGQNLGAGKPERAERAVWTAGFYNLVFLLAVALLFIVFARDLVGLFTDDPAALAYGASSLRILSYGYGFYAYGMVLIQAFNGAGDTRTPTVINLFCYWIFQIPLAFLLSQSWGLGAHGVFWAVTIAETALTIVGVAVFRKGTWRAREI